MAAEYIFNEIQAISLNNPVVFRNSIPCTKGYVIHNGEEGIFILRGITNGQCYATYQVTFNGNIAIPEGGTVAPIAVALAVNGEARPTSKAIYTPAAVGDYGNVTSTAIIKVPRGCCFSLSVDSIAANSTDTPAPTIDVQNANLVISRIA